MKITQFGSTTFATTNVQDTFGVRSAPSGLMDTPYGAVNVITDPTDHFADVARKRLELFASTPAALSTALDSMRALRGEWALLYIETYGGDTRSTLARCTRVSYGRTARNFNRQEITLEFAIGNALWDGDSGDGSTSKSSGQTTTINNGGNANVNDLQLVLTPSANATAWTIVCADSGVNLSFGAQVDANDELDIHAGTWAVLNNNANAWGDLTLNATHEFAGLLRLVPGDNDFVISWTGGGTIDVDYYFNDKWK